MCDSIDSTTNHFPFLVEHPGVLFLYVGETAYNLPPSRYEVGALGICVLETCVDNAGAGDELFDITLNIPPKIETLGVTDILLG